MPPRAALGQQAVARQGLALTPAMRQSMKLLELSGLELADLIAEALAENPLLEAAGDVPNQAVASPRARPVPRPRRASPLPPGLGRIWRKLAARGREAPVAGEDEAPAPGPSLHEHLLLQLGTDVADPVDRAIGRVLIETVDEAGYLTSTVEEVAARLAQKPERVAAVLARLQGFDPSGVCARSLAECLALQLADRGRLDASFRLLLDNLQLLAEGNRRALGERCGVDQGRLAGMVAELAKLDPRPGLAFDRAEPASVAPDIVIERGPDGRWLAELDERSQPRLAINEGYAAKVGKDGAARRFLAERRQSAHWLLSALERRGQTLLRVAAAIVERQGGFLDDGAAALQPLSRREIAAGLGLHESTVGRAIANKYAATPRGVMPLARFFDGRLAEAGQGMGHAPGAVRLRLKRLIESESPARPLSDARLGDLLRREGVGISRRTVAKYREMLRIPPAFRRRRAGALQAGARHPT